MDHLSILLYALERRKIPFVSPSLTTSAAPPRPSPPADSPAPRIPAAIRPHLARSLDPGRPEGPL